MHPVLSTDRLLLKPITPALIHDLFRTQSKADIMAFFGIDEAGYQRMLAMHEKGIESYQISLFYFLLVRKDNGLPIGDCGFHSLNKTHRRAELFYILRNDADKNQGFVGEALPLVLNYGFNTLNLHRVEALIDGNNVPSLKLLQRHRFVKEGVMREDYHVNGKNESSDCYSLLAQEWAGKK